MYSNLPPNTKSFKVYTTSIKSCQQNAYHLATFNNKLQNPNELPKYIREEMIQNQEQQNMNKHSNVHEMARQERQFNQNNNQENDEKPQELLRGQKQQQRFVFEETVSSTFTKPKNVVYHGTDSTQYSGSVKSTRDGRQFLPNNDFSSANYALMIFDKKREAFRLVPIQRHLQFEKQKNFAPKVQKPEKVTPQEPFQNRLTSSLTQSRQIVDKKKSGKSFINGLKQRIKANNTRFIGGMQTEKQIKFKRSQKNKVGRVRNEDEEQDSMPSDDDGNDEYNQQAKDQFNENSDDGGIVDQEFEDEEQSEEGLFDDSGKLKKGKEPENAQKEQKVTKQILDQRQKNKEKMRQQEKRQNQVEPSNQQYSKIVMFNEAPDDAYDTDNLFNNDDGNDDEGSFNQKDDMDSDDSEIPMVGQKRPRQPSQDSEDSLKPQKWMKK